MDAQKLLAHFRERNESTIQNITELVEIESPSYDEAGSRSAVDWIESGIVGSIQDAVSERISIDGVGDHLIVRINGANERKPILLLGHSDTVHPRGSSESNPTRIEDGKLYGCGTFDMKANIAVMIEVFRALENYGAKPFRPVTVLIACDEEVGSETGRPIVEREALKSEFCLVFEPSAKGRVKTARKGTGGYVLTANGIPSHAGLDPEKGASAILEISKQIERLHGFTDFSVGTNVTVGTIEGGTATNVVPAKAVCSIDVRFETLVEAERIEKEIRSLEAFDERVSLTIDGEINRPPMERTEGVAALFERAKRIASEFDYELGETKVGGASDGNFVGALGVPLLDGLGISGDGAHTLVEYVEVDDIPNRATLLAKLLMED